LETYVLTNDQPVNVKMDNQKVKQNRKFANTIGIALLLIFTYGLLLKHRYLWVVLAIALFLMLLGLFVPKSLTNVRLLWERIGHTLGVINTYVLLTLFYFLVLTPFALIMNIMKKDILKLKWHAKADTYWEHTIKIDDSHMENQF